MSLIFLLDRVARKQTQARLNCILLGAERSGLHGRIEQSVVDHDVRAHDVYYYIESYTLCTYDIDENGAAKSGLPH